jgi:hypothetical protein
VRRFSGLAALLLAVLATAAPAGAVDGRQSPDPTLEPSEVATASAAFALSVPGNASCDGTGSDGWRADTFIVNDDVDVSTLDFTVPGLPAGWVGADFDSARDGTVAAPLFRTSGVAVSMIPAVRPAGQINPSALAGFTFDPTIWNLAAGEYRIGFACIGPTNEVRQWWATAVTVASSPESSVMTVASAAGRSSSTPATTALVAAPTPGAAGDSAPPSSTAAALESESATTDPTPDGGQREGASATSAAPDSDGNSPWALVALVVVVLAVVVGLVAYWLARSARARRPRAVTAARRPEGTLP